ncbi:SDR family oxidoreductase [Cupriavidus basilensis]|uniref:SDR family oxidoreductase n=1 Tax=Cupriavidus basilensis TaxID=68895 RepID=A0ABT6ARU4_9BURK|nr:SDR family oxidoreductase [Cupriavidus basilensis]MDF3835179.1 SDR family oxidoreductase [Cupriavidus basilensis]
MLRLQDKVVMITGAASGLGAAFSRAAALAGASVVLADIDDAAGQGLAEALRAEGASAGYQRLDVTSEAGWETAMAAVRERHGRLDVLANNAGIALRGSVADCSLADWQRTLDVNLTGVFLGCRAALPLMRAGGAIVNVSSVYGQVGGAQVAAYCAAKGGVTLLTRSAALHGAALKPPVRVNSIHPGFVDTPMTQGALDLPDASGTTARKRIEGMTPLGRLATPDEIVGVFLLLASDEGRYITGSQFTVDGGLTAQ